MRTKRVGEPLSVVYSIKLTQSQRIKLLQLGGPKWLREQIDKVQNEKTRNGNETITHR
jgi:hypothetical protein